MASEASGSAANRDSERSLKKDSGSAGPVLRAQRAGVEFTADVADAFASSWKSFRDRIVASNQLFDGSVLRGSVEAAATFLEGIAKATRNSYDQFCATRGSAATTAPADIDYDRLAKLIAAEMRNPSK
jgi:hypothetical protein